MTEILDHVKPTEMENQQDYFKQVIELLEEGVFFVDREKRITYWNRACEKITGCSFHEMVGRICCQDFFYHLDEKGNCICEFKCPINEAIYTNKVYECELEILHKREGSIPIYVRTMPLHDQCGNRIGAAVFFMDITIKKELLKKVDYLEEKSTIDVLTNLPNRSLIEYTIKSRFNEFQRYGWNFGLILIDIDHFKNINDKYGHDVGDRVLKTLSEIFQHKQRTCDMIGRWGGEEFLGVISNVEKFNLYGISERIRLMVENTKINVEGKRIHVTISIGCTLIKEDDTIESLLKRVDLNLYQSKHKGRNCITIE